MLAEVEATTIDGKYLRGSKRRESGLPALQAVTAVAQGLGVVLGQSAGAETDSIGATLELLQRLPLTGQVVTMDAGLLHQDVATGSTTFNRGQVSHSAWRTKKALEGRPRRFGSWGGCGTRYHNSSSIDHSWSVMPAAISGVRRNQRRRWPGSCSSTRRLWW